MNLVNVVAPIYNEQGVINEFVSQVSKSLETFTQDYKILLIDDGSSDDSWNEISDICDQNKKVTGIKLSKNFGHHYAITAGIHSSDSEWVVVMDSDLQDRPEVIPELYKKAIQGFDVVFVSRIQRPESIWYIILQKIFYFLLRVLSGIKFDSSQANFSIISRKVVEAFMQFPEQARFYGSTISWLGFKKASVEAKHGQRYYGKPSYTIRKRIKLASDIILAFSDRPLKFSIYLGFFLALLSLSLFIIFILLIQTNIIFFNSFNLISILALFLFSIFLISNGIVGIYISKIFLQVKNRPLFIVTDKIN